VRVALLDRGEVSGETTGLGEGNVLCSDKEAGPELALAAAGLALFDEIEELLGESAGIRRKGALVVHTDEVGWAAEPARLDDLREAGVECLLLDVQAVREAEPELTGSMFGASWFPHDLQCSPRAIARGLAREAERLGAAVMTGCEVRAIAVDGGRIEGLETAGGRIAADAVVLAAGAWSAPLARSAGLELPVEPRKGQLVRLECRPRFLRC
jgi:glycine/D-amino acid oxidase-like deaminating enzyme